ncbi:MAG: ribosome-associated ATPase/putative transporter RbbA [Neisseria sp.]|nr:ribosome-associated ATPase/putative transporter RbbA [Neisseria sp.]
MSTVLALTGVTHRYGSKQALHDVSFSLPAGATAALVGPDGVGKSTLLSLLAGVKKLQTGEITVLGHDVRSAQERDRLAHRVAFMPQGLGKNLYPTLSVLENIEFFARLYGLPEAARRAQISRLLDATGLAPFADRAAIKLSGGMKQKLSLCCALVHTPELLILDEPTTGVDPLSRRQFWALTDSLRAEHRDMTMLVATAYMEEAQHFEHLLAMNDGELLAAGPMAEVLAANDSNSVEAAFIALLPPEKRGTAGEIVIPPFVADPHEPPVIEAHHLSKRFGDFTAVDDVSFTIARGEIFGFLGSNGCGKSTTMKMLTGLLQADEGSATLLGKPIDASDMATRMRVGYMSQAFSLYEELSVRQNLRLHADLYPATAERAAAVVEEALQRFDLSDNAEAKPAALSLGIRQRLQLAAACLHSPELLILDEPTSGVDPAARDMFWRYLIHLSREEKVTIFVSTHFMNEAALCDRISLMHQGRVLAMGTPPELQAAFDAPSLEEAFIVCLQQNHADESPTTASHHTENDTADIPASTTSGMVYWLATMLTFARRETVELLRDKVRLVFAFIGPLILLFSIALCVSFDIFDIPFAVLDRDQSAHSRQLVQEFSGSRYFAEAPPIADTADIERVLASSQVRMVMDIPPNYGKDLMRFRQPEVAYYLDGAQPFIAENVRGFIGGITLPYMQQFSPPQALGAPSLQVLEPRFAYNQEFKSIYAITPGVLMLALMLIPTMLTALGVVREKEMGSIINLYASPASVSQYLLGKQLPYVVLGMLMAVMLLVVSVFVLEVPFKGSLLGFLFGALLFIITASGIGLLISCFVRSQIAALFTAAIMTMIPAANFSGLTYPVSTLEGSSYWIGKIFPASWFQLISLGSFTKGSEWSDLLPMYGALSVTSVVVLAAACYLLKKQED